MTSFADTSVIETTRRAFVLARPHIQSARLYRTIAFTLERQSADWGGGRACSLQNGVFILKDKNVNGISECEDALKKYDFIDAAPPPKRRRRVAKVGTTTQEDLIQVRILDEVRERASAWRQPYQHIPRSSSSTRPLPTPCFVCPSCGRAECA